MHGLVVYLQRMSLGMVGSMIGFLWLGFTVGCDGAGVSPGPNPNNSNFYVKYSHLKEIEALDAMMKWYVQNEDDSLRGPFDSHHSGIVDLGEDPRSEAIVSKHILPSFYYTYMGTPVGGIDVYTGNTAGSDTLKLTLHDAAVGQEVKIAHIFDDWHTVAQDPFSISFTPFPTNDIRGSNDLLSLFVRYRASPDEEPLGRYGYMLDFKPDAISNLSLDAGNLPTCIRREWISTVDLSEDLPQVYAYRLGVMHMEVAEGIHDGTGKAGGFGLPEQFPADAWYLTTYVDGLMPTVIARFDPKTNQPVELDPLDRYIVEESMVLDTQTNTFRFQLAAKSGLPGTDEIGYGELLMSAGGSLLWRIVFSWSYVEIDNGVFVLSLPRLPNHDVLPAFESYFLTLYRLDQGSSAKQMISYEYNHKTNLHPSWAMTSESKFVR